MLHRLIQHTRLGYTTLLLTLSIQPLAVCVSVLSIVCTGCGDRKMPTAHFVVPVGFRGGIVIIEDSPDGIIVPRIEEQEIYEIPESGILKIAGRAPFSTWQRTSAEWSDGSRLLTDHDLMGDEGYLGDPNTTIALWGGALDNEGNLWMYVGPRSEYFKATQSLEWRPGERVE